MSREILNRAVVLGGGLLLAVGLAFASQGCRDSRDVRTEAQSPCTPCHGDPKREGSDLDKAAPPIDLSGKTEPSSRGVGAHQIHLTASATHGKIACNECHQVPETLEDPGHADDAYPAEVKFEFAELAGKRNFTPSYAQEGYTCANSYCHRSENPKWTEPRSSDDACGTCHGLPPEQIVDGNGPLRPHPQSKECDNCHENLVRAGEKWTFKDPSRHVDGNVDVKEMECNVCHGNPSNNAPPKDLAGNMERTALGVGAHQEHLAGGQNSRAVQCNECHVVPQNVEDPGHLDDTTPNAEVTFGGVAVAQSSAPAWDRGSETCAGSWCHGPKQLAASVSPKWTRTEGPLGCTDCHGYPPPAPHPQMARCSFCHTQTIGPDNQTIINRDLHVDGKVDHEMPMACNACHGNETNAAPPIDLAGNTSTTERGVGAHQAHLTPSSWHRSVQCDDCHTVPQSVFDPGHFDSTLPAELAFSNVATGIQAPFTPVWNGATCSDVWCHRAKLSGGEPAWNTPSWTSQLTAGCETCHGFPPPPPHMQITTCELCHSANWTGTWFKDPALHIDGKVDFAQ
jgi:predicted CxxxxCH...CXXCH cytochrome family protein